MMPIPLARKRDSKGSGEWHLREISAKNGRHYCEVVGNPASPYRRASLLCHSNGVEQALLAGRPRSKAGRKIFVFDGTAKMGT